MSIHAGRSWAEGEQKASERETRSTVGLPARARGPAEAAPALRRDRYRRSWRRRASRDGIDIGAPRLRGDVEDQVRVRLRLRLT